jgi:hypothetical protein
VKNFISHQLRFRAMLRVFEKYPEQFSGKPEVNAAITRLAANTNRIGEILSGLAVSRQILINPKIDSAFKLRRALFTVADIGIALGSQREDDTQVKLFMSYRAGSWSFSTWKLLQAGIKTVEELSAYSEATANLGLTVEMFESFSEQVSAFAELLDGTDEVLKSRKANRQEMNILFKTNSSLLKFQIEPVIRLEGKANPAILREYLIARHAGASKKKNNQSEQSAEISGTITDIVTGLPVANATVDIAALELITTTDEDGFYIFEEIPAGSLIISCNASGYRLPEKVNMKAAGGESLRLDFSLQPEAAPAS